MRSALGGRLGYQGMRPSVAVFFDSESGCGQKVGIAINGSSVDGCAAGVAPPFDLYGSPVTVWVAYDAASTTLQVFLAQDTNKPAAPLLAQTVDIRATARGGGIRWLCRRHGQFLHESRPPQLALYPGDDAPPGGRTHANPGRQCRGLEQQQRHLQ